MANESQSSESYELASGAVIDELAVRYRRIQADREADAMRVRVPEDLKSRVQLGSTACEAVRPPVPEPEA